MKAAAGQAIGLGMIFLAGIGIVGYMTWSAHSAGLSSRLAWAIAGNRVVTDRIFPLVGFSYLFIGFAVLSNRRARSGQVRSSK